MEREQLKSEMIRSAGYDPVEQILELEFVPKKGFTSGPVYQYPKFLPSDWADFRQAKSPGRHFLERIKGTFEAKRVADPQPAEQKDPTIGVF